MSKVTVVVATYRREKEFARALESLSSQTFNEFDIVVVDDNDNEEWNKKVATIIEQVKKCSNVQLDLVVNHPNLGSAKARNKGIEKASGEYITFLDDDDIYLPNKIANQYNIMIEFSADYSLSDLVLHYEDDSISEIRKRKYLNTKEAHNLLLCHLKYHMTGTDTMMFKTSYIRQIGGFDPIDIGDEFFLMMKAIKNEGNFVYVPFSDVIAYVHMGEGGLSSGQGKIDGENRLYKFKKQFFKDLKKSDIRYINMRHYAVLAFAYFRAKKLGRFFFYAMRCFLISPKGAIRLLLERK